MQGQSVAVAGQFAHSAPDVLLHTRAVAVKLVSALQGYSLFLRAANGA